MYLLSQDFHGASRMHSHIAEKLIVSLQNTEYKKCLPLVATILNPPKGYLEPLLLPSFASLKQSISPGVAEKDLNLSIQPLVCPQPIHFHLQSCLPPDV